jgi:hypothetical protein
VAESAGQGAPAGPQWRRPLIAAAITLVIALGLLAFGYARMRDQADDSAGAIHGTKPQVTQPASGSRGASGKRKQAQPAPGAAAPSR